MLFEATSRDCRALTQSAPVAPIANRTGWRGLPESDVADSKIETSFVDSPTTIDYTDSSLFVQPKINMSAGIQYGIPLFGGRLTPRVDAFYQSHRTNGPINQPQRDPDWIVGGYTVLNGRLSYDTDEGNWQVALTATNLTDKFYWNQLGARTTAAGALSDARAGTPGAPRQWAITVRKSFWPRRRRSFGSG
jgi:iron complex outermembrane recepter protein